jgi:hypothetical protein
MHALKRRLAKYSRWLHIYASMTSFVIVFFFAVTGWTLNHAEWFNGRERTSRAAGALDTRWTNTGTGDVARLEIVEALRKAHRVSGAVSDFRVDDDQVSVAFKGPGYAADAAIDRKSGKYDLTESRLGLIAIANDLHKGRDTGGVWKLVIDVSAGLLTFISLTGLILIYFIHKHRLAGLILLVAGGALAGLLYAVWVP